MLRSEPGQDLCGWREEILFRFQIWQVLGIDSGKEKKMCIITCAWGGGQILVTTGSVVW